MFYIWRPLLFSLLCAQKYVEKSNYKKLLSVYERLQWWDFFFRNTDKIPAQTSAEKIFIKSLQFQFPIVSACFQTLFVYHFQPIAGSGLYANDCPPLFFTCLVAEVEMTDVWIYEKLLRGLCIKALDLLPKKLFCYPISFNFYLWNHFTIPGFLSVTEQPQMLSITSAWQLFFQLGRVHHGTDLYIDTPVVYASEGSLNAADPLVTF